MSAAGRIRRRRRAGMREVERAAAPGLALDPHPAAPSRPAAGDGQAETRAAVSPRRRPVGLRERLEDASLLAPAGCRCPCRARRTAAATRLRRVRSTSSTSTHDLAALGELDGVADQVDQDLPQRGRVADERVGHVGRDVAMPARGPSRAACSGQRLERVARARRAARTASRSSSSLPASIFEKSRMSLMIASSDVGRRRAPSAGSRAARRRASVSSSRSVMPMMPFIGVRISWLMLARNSLFARLAPRPAAAPPRARADSPAAA